jgi:hypothetical protein
MKNIDELDILQVEEFQDFQVLDVVTFNSEYPDWNRFLTGIVFAIKNELVTGKSDLELLSNAYDFARVMFIHSKLQAGRKETTPETIDMRLHNDSIH